MRLLIVISAIAWQVAGRGFTSNELSVYNVTSEVRRHALEKVVDSANKFALKMYKVVTENKTENFAYSPYDTFMLLSIATEGAVGNTKEQLRKFLDLPDNDPNLLSGFQALSDKLKLQQYLGPAYVRDYVYVRDHLRPRGEFLALSEYAFRTWASASGAGSNFLLGGEFSLPCRLQSYVSANSTKQTPGYRHIADHRYGVIPEIQAKFIEIPCAAGTNQNTEPMSIFIILPDDHEGLAKLEQAVDKDTVSKLHQAGTRKVNVWVPNLRILTRKNLRGILASDPELSDVFSENRANFTKISEVYAGSIGTIDQKTDISINDKFVPATNLTSQSVESGEEVVDFIADRPFMLIATTTADNPVILAMGHNTGHIQQYIAPPKIVS